MKPYGMRRVQVWDEVDRKGALERGRGRARAGAKRETWLGAAEALFPDARKMNAEERAVRRASLKRRCVPLVLPAPES